MTTRSTQEPSLTAVTIGNFDGVHLGHASLVRACREHAGSSGRVVALAFDPHPFSTLAPGKCPPRLTSFDERADRLRSLGVDQVIQLHPTPELLGLNPQEFIDRVVMPLRPTALVEGDDFHFGRARSGNTRVLAELGLSRGFGVMVCPAVEVGLDGQWLVRASSTVARWLISHGRVADAARVLGRPFSVRGQVTRGDQRGRSIGYRTANISTDQVLPADGVYAGRLDHDGRSYPAAISVGTRPTFNGATSRVEAHAMNPDGTPATLPDAYDWLAVVTFDRWVRDDLRFDGVESLRGQIDRDARRCLNLLASLTTTG
ncbi:MAG: bifunctional riboflavin kinase/FMN adenylyltransferase [Phycisphaeraceae bacterium]|nr:bifunctional riboflavin kinase/FMN adenylyltransferase [Phycisphaerae bacterium]MBX3391253.1 bifunctional riboflavin kinase/FMN adenylyltransferase [Phycisphaeraceae bacterium]